MKHKIFTFLLAMVTSMSLWAIGRGDGSTKDDAIDYDWENGVLHLESEGTSWYRLDLEPLYYADSLRLSITNVSDTEVNVVCKATVWFPVEDVMINSDSLKLTLAPQAACNGWVLRRELVSARIREIYFTVSSTGTVKLSWQAFFPTGESCENAKHGSGEQEAGTTWYKLYAPYYDERTNLESMVISLGNWDNGTSNTVTVNFRTVCDSPVIRSKTFSIEPYRGDTIVFSADYLESLGWPDLLLSCTSSTDCYMDYEFVYYGTSCEKAISLDWGQGNIHQGLAWYRLDVNPDLIPEDKDLRLHFENLSHNTNSVHATISYACNHPDVIHRDFTIDANDEANLDITRDVIEIMGWPNFYINYQSDYDSRIRLELIQKHPKDTFVTYDTAYVCQGDAFYTWREYIIEEPTFWTDTIDSILVNDYWIMDAGVLHNYAVYPFQKPHLFTKEELDELPVVEKGRAIDASSATDALLAKFHNANIAYYPGERPMDVTNIKWQVQTENGWQDMPYTVPDNAASVVMRYVVTTECETELTSADLVFNLNSSSEPCIIASDICGAEGDNLTWTLSCDSVLTVTGSGDMRNGITNLGWHQYASYIRVVILPEGLTSIGEEAFYNCIDLQSVNMPESVSVLGNKAFVGCNSLTVPVYNSKIFAFMPRNYVGSYSIPEGIETVAAYAFEKCISNGGALYEIALPSTVKHLGDYSLGAPYLQKITCIAVDPPICDTKAFVCFFDEQDVIYFVNKSIPVYVPAQSVEAYKAADVWKEFENILPIEGTEEPIETVEGNYTIYYVDKDSQDMSDEIVTLHVPVAPVIDGFTFVEWRVSEGSLSLGITIQAVYEANEQTSAPAVYTNPANPAQKLIRNGNVYILTDDKVYSITGQKVQSY